MIRREEDDDNDNDDDNGDSITTDIKSIRSLGHVLVTGGAGFIGSHLVNRLVHEKVPTTVIDRLDYCSRIDNWWFLKRPFTSLDRVFTVPEGRFKFYEMDIRSELEVMNVLQERKIDTIFHLAAQTHVDNSFLNSEDFIRDNILGTHNLLKVCIKYGGIKKFIHMSTDEVYGESKEEGEKGEDRSPLVFNEESPPNPTNPYAATKVGAESMVQSFSSSFKIPSIIVRCNNVYGWGQYPEKLIPKFSLQAAEGMELTIQGDGSSRRSFIHVEDVVNALLTVSLRGTPSKIYNIGTENEYSVLEIANIILEYYEHIGCLSSDVEINNNNRKKKILSSSSSLESLPEWFPSKYKELIRFIPDRKFNDRRYHIDDSRLKSLGWKEKMDFETEFIRTIQWYRERKEEYKTKSMLL